MTEKETEQNMLMEFIADTCKIDINEKIDYPPVCLSYGEKVLQSDKGDSNNTNRFRNFWQFKCDNCTAKDP